MDHSPLSESRLWMTVDRRGVSHVPVLGRYNNIRARPALAEHTHPGEMEICLLVKGRQTYRVHGCNYPVRGGDVFLTFPGERHSTGETPEEKGILYWMILRLPKKGESFLGLPSRQARAVLNGLLKIPVRHFRGSRQMKEDLDAITVLYHQPDALAPAQMANRITAFLLEVIRCAGRSTGIGRGDSLRAVLAYIASHLEENLSVPDLAARAGLSVARFSALFKEETGIPPAEYVLRAKVEEGRRRLERREESVTNIAYDLGFSSSQYFATVFKRLKGVSPRDIVRQPSSSR